MANKIVRVKIPVPEKKPEAMLEATNGLEDRIELDTIVESVILKDYVEESIYEFICHMDAMYNINDLSNKKSKKEDDTIIVHYSNLYNTNEYKQYK